VKLFLPATILLLLSGCYVTDSSSGAYTAQSTQSAGDASQNPQPVPPAPSAPPTQPAPPPVNPAGIWDVNDVVNGNRVSEVALIANGMYFVLAATDQLGCAEITGGDYTVNGSMFKGSGLTTLLDTCTGPNDNFTWTLNGYLMGGNLNLSFDNGGAVVPTLGATPDPLYNEPSSLTKLAGNWDDNGNTLTVNPDGTFFEQQASGCVVNGAYTILDPAHNLYGVSFEFSNCSSSLAGIPFTGLGYLDDSDPNAWHFLEDAMGPIPGSGGAIKVVFDNITPQ
jgi:hypothetical protein